MKQVKDSVTVRTLLGKSLPTPITVDYGYGEYETPDELRAAGDWPNDKTILENENASRKLAAAAKAKNENPAIKAFIESVTGTVEYRREKWVADSLKQMPNADRAVLEAFAAQNIQ